MTKAFSQDLLFQSNFFDTAYVGWTVVYNCMEDFYSSRGNWMSFPEVGTPVSFRLLHFY